MQACTGEEPHSSSWRMGCLGRRSSGLWLVEQTEQAVCMCPGKLAGLGEESCRCCREAREPLVPRAGLLSSAWSCVRCGWQGKMLKCLEALSPVKKPLLPVQGGLTELLFGNFVRAGISAIFLPRLVCCSTVLGLVFFTTVSPEVLEF